MLYFFFQAEDGIRDLYVTGVQTCALPISERMVVPALVSGDPMQRSSAIVKPRCAPTTHVPKPVGGDEALGRSEERRVGKECRCEWSPYHSQTKCGHQQH